MKKEQKRYFLVEYCGMRTYHIENDEQLKIMYDRLRKYNSRKTPIYIFGNITVSKVEDGYDVTTHVYHKLTQRSKISDLDKFTSDFSESELISIIQGHSLMDDNYIPDINIAYLSDDDKNGKESKLERRIKYIPVLYSEDCKYLDEEYVKKCLDFHASKQDLNFFRCLAEEFCFHKDVAKEIEQLRIACDCIKNYKEMQWYNFEYLYFHALKLYNGLVYERDRDGHLIRDENGGYQISRRRQRDFGFFIKNYGSSLRSPLKYNDSLIPITKEEYKKIRQGSENKQLELKIN